MAKLEAAFAGESPIAESKVHAAPFRATLEKARKRFTALARVEERHASHYQARLDQVSGQAT